jgi:ParB/RepB/Spo0J family partition protein
MVAAQQVPTVERLSIPLSKLEDSAFNPRKTYDEKRCGELADNMKAIGQLQPALVRPHPKKPGFYEIAAGHRRRRAGKKAGFTELDCLVRDLSDAEMIIVGITENTDRDALEPLEEADAYVELKKQGLTVEQIGDKIGKSAAHIHRRLRLAHLDPAWRKAVAEKKVAPNAAALVSRLESLEDQRALLKDVRMPGAGEDPIVAHNLNWHIEKFLRVLKDAPFKTDDAQLVAAAGACTNCPKRTLAQAKLFGEEAFGNDAKDRCTDGVCWDNKTKAHSLVVIAKAKEKGGEVLDEKAAKKRGILIGEQGYISSNYVKLDEKTYTDSGRETTPAAMLKNAGVEAEPVMVIVNGKAEQLVERKVVERARTTIAKKNAPASSSSSTRSKPAPKVDKELEEAEHAAVLTAIVKRAETKQDAALWRGIAMLVESSGVGDAHAVAKRRGWSLAYNSAKKAIEKTKDIATLAGIIVELLSDDGGGASGVYPTELTKDLGLDVKAITKKAGEELKKKREAEKAAKAKASPATAKKTTTKKKGAKK